MAVSAQDDDAETVDERPSRELDALVGQILDHKYLVEELVGTGAMGKVFRARHAQVGNVFALKVLRATLDDADRARQRFAREAKATGLLEHPNLVRVWDAGVTDHGLPYLVMEMVEGESLGERIARVGALPFQETIAIALQLYAGLAHAHREGVIHRDVKPDNVILCPDGLVKVVDFGLARLLYGDHTGITKTGEIVGTPSFISPEQAHGLAVDAKCDAWAATACVYHMATGQLPFTGRRLLQIVKELLTAAPIPPTVHRAELPDSFDALVEAGLRKEPQEREGCAELLRRVRQIEAEMTLLDP